MSFGGSDRSAIRRAIAGVKPRGQTPLGYSLEQVAADFGSFRGERAVVLVTDGLESCGGDPVAAARRLHQESGVTVHVIGFGLGSAADADAASLRAIAQASGGRFVSAGSAAELRDACKAATRVAVLDRNYAAGAGGIFWQDVCVAFQGYRDDLLIQNYLTGLCGGDVTPTVIDDILADLGARAAAGAPVWMGIDPGEEA